MCGFIGYFDPNFNHEEYIIKEMSDQIISRGPDSYGVYIDRNIGISFQKPHRACVPDFIFRFREIKVNALMQKVTDFSVFI